jgi:hypothetical protein
VLKVSDWKRAWGEDCVATLQGDGHMLPIEALRFLTDYGLPKVVIFEGTATFEIHSTPLANDLCPYNMLIRWGDCYDADRDRAWGQQFVIADEDFCNGSACYCVHASTGVVTRIDCGITRPESFVNSSVALFGDALLAAAHWSSQMPVVGARPGQDSLWVLGERLRSVDPIAFEEPSSFWPSLIAFVSREDPGWLEITSNPEKSKPRF